MAYHIEGRSRCVAMCKPFSKRHVSQRCLNDAVPGSEFCRHHDPSYRLPFRERRARRLVAELEALGYAVTLTDQPEKAADAPNVPPALRVEALEAQQALRAQELAALEAERDELRTRIARV